MKQVVFDEFGDVDVLRMAETDVPVPESNTVLIKTKAVSINPIDWKIRAGEMKVMTGSRFPKGVGIDFSGTVEGIGEQSGRFKIGDEVFGALNAMRGGALAEYLVISEDDVCHKPSGITFEQAAAMPIVGSAAMQIFDKLIHVRKGTEILINGATGGIGMFAVQIAKNKGAVVTAVASPKGISLLEKWDADEVVDYTKQNILDSTKRFDAVIDLSGRLPFAKARILLKAKAVYVNTVPTPTQMLSSLFHNLLSPQKNRVLFSKPTPGYLKALASYTENGMDVVVSKTFPMPEFKLAYSEVPQGGVLGKAVFSVT